MQTGREGLGLLESGSKQRDQRVKNKGKVVARRKMFNWLYAGKSVYNNTGESHATKV